MRKDWLFEALRAFAIEATIRPATKTPPVAGSHDAPTGRGPARPEVQFKQFADCGGPRWATW
jgi:hypothetical protein